MSSPHNSESAKGGGGVGGIKTGKNTASMQQDAHGPEKDGRLDPGNGEKRRGRGYILDHSCAPIEKFLF